MRTTKADRDGMTFFMEVFPDDCFTPEEYEDWREVLKDQFPAGVISPLHEVEKMETEQDCYYVLILARNRESATREAVLKSTAYFGGVDSVRRCYNSGDYIFDTMLRDEDGIWPFAESEADVWGASDVRGLLERLNRV